MLGFRLLDIRTLYTEPRVTKKCIERRTARIWDQMRPGAHERTQVAGRFKSKSPFKDSRFKASVVGNDGTPIPGYLFKFSVDMREVSCDPLCRHAVHGEGHPDYFKPGVHDVLRRGHLVERILRVVVRLYVDR